MDTAPAAPPTAREPYDLREFFHAVGSFSGERALAQSPAPRLEANVEVELLDAEPSEIIADPLVVAGFVDGIQNALCVTYRGHRPVYLTYVAAGAVSPSGRPLRVRERLSVVASRLDTEWVEGIGTDIPMVTLDEERPDLLATRAVELIGGERENLERALVEDLVDDGEFPLLVDGSLVGRPVRPEIVGVVKTVARRYLPDESVLWGLPAGWRSPRFRIPAGAQGVTADRYSCYLRLHSASARAWDFALVRLEAFTPEIIDSLAALALNETQSARSGDHRFDRHLAGVRAVENMLRARRPAVYSL
jgi:hypothetical protein